MISSICVDSLYLTHFKIQRMKRNATFDLFTFDMEKREKYRNIVYISKCLRHRARWWLTTGMMCLFLSRKDLISSWISVFILNRRGRIYERKMHMQSIFFIFIFMRNEFTEQSFDSMLLFFFAYCIENGEQPYGNHYKIASEITIKWKSTRGIWNKIPTEENKMLQWAHTLHAMRAYEHVPHITYFHLKWLQFISFTWKFLGFCPRTDLSFNESKPHGYRLHNTVL